MAEAGRKIMYQHYRKMCEHEPGTRVGDDPEELHDMRVATRRLRAAYLLFEPYFDDKAMGRFNKRLRSTGRMLGAVRDLDVLLGKAERYQAEELAGGPGLEPLIAAWHEQRDQERNPGQPVPYQARHIAPHLLMSRYEDVRAYECVLPDAPLTTYHQLRITCKKLRYALEFFRDLLGDGAGGLIKKVTAMQDLLGDVQDASVAEGLIAGFVAEQVGRHAGMASPPPLEGVTAYLAAQWRTQRELLGRFPSLWSELTGYEFRRSLAVAIAEL
jgi:CHAD domain-containing protein